jgi:DNA polymerase III epsilon subunit-like protein
VFKRVANLLSEKCTKKENCVMVGHNSDFFDTPLLLRMFSECNLAVPKNITFKDTYIESKKKFPSLPMGYSLQGIFKHLSKQGLIKLDTECQSHSAECDALKTAMIYSGISKT